MTPAPPAPNKKSRTRRFIALSVLGLAVVGGIVAFAMLRGDDDDEPSRSRDAVIKRTFAALAAGDEKALFELAEPTRTFAMISRCEKRSNDVVDPLEGEDRDPEELEEHWRTELQLLLRRTKGTKLEVVDILTELPPPLGTRPKKSSTFDDDDRGERDRDREDDDERPERDNEYKTTTFKKGHEVARGCYAKIAFRRQQVKVVVDITDGDRELTQRTRLMLQEIDGKWYLASPPSLNVGLDVIVADVEQWRDKTCKCTDAACVEDLDEAHRPLTRVQYQLDRDSDLSRDTMRRIEKIQRERRVCEGTARGGPDLARYKALKDELCACTDEECGRKLELEMREVRRNVDANFRGARFSLLDPTTEVATAASECTRKLSRLGVRAYAAWPTGGDRAGGTLVTIRGTNFMTSPRTAKVWFGTKEATGVRIATDTELVVESPPQDALGVVDVRVQFEPGGTVSVPYGFTYRAPLEPLSKRKRKPTTQ